eukprot:CAMPEP_0113571550 /NCGR_PEP_ID=MMETSP0015_2-20120614/25614_1 /TAXON_ID=2838 /ORGANISM="Odontella" /LENGTH=395 /DNA_ID=CAMNT_0000474509 /DNA_START=13 /DNA_END=1200 /DNA_ORIENTATION=+ /assembly_acc=CAM_ASM_000160
MIEIIRQHVALLGSWTSLYVITLVSIAAVALAPLLVFLLAFATVLRKWSRSGHKWSDLNTALFSGRVAHTRFQPRTHSFSYPLFFCCLDLDEVNKIFRVKSDLWPLSLLMQFRDEDHLKNDEGLQDGFDNTLRSRISRLVSGRTGGKCAPDQNQRILLVTHLSYFGYCFNPVSFYYILKSETKTGFAEIDAIVAEVSNTPWNEMRCYVLHPDSKDVTTANPGRAKRDRDAVPIGRLPEDDGNGTKSDSVKQDSLVASMNYVFPKTFHVSPFMEMEHMYDWTFWMPQRDRISVSTTMIKGETTFFNAYFDIRRQAFHPMALCWQLIRLPAYCAIIQVWIHIEAFRIFLKGVEFVPHPEGAETGASRMIGKIMAPFFPAKEWLNSLSNRGVKSKKDD